MDELKQKLLFAKIFFESNEQLSKKLPIKFKKNSVNRYNCQCVKCNSEIEDKNIRGSLNKLLGNVYEINAVALCENCLLFNVHDNIRLREDEGRIAKQFYVKGKGWVTQVYDNQKQGLLEKLIGI